MLKHQKECFVLSLFYFKNVKTQEKNVMSSLLFIYLSPIPSRVGSCRYRNKEIWQEFSFQFNSDS